MNSANTKIGNTYLATLSSTTSTSSSSALTRTQWCNFSLPIGVWMFEAIVSINTINVPFVEWYLAFSTQTAYDS